MKKKTVKKLTLARETICDLERSDLQKAAGGASLTCPTTSRWYACWGTLVSCNFACGEPF